MPEAIKSMVWATSIDVLAPDHTLTRRGGYWVVQSPSNPTYWWGNLLLFDEPPAVGDGERWEALFRQEFASRPEVSHRCFAWDSIDGATGAAERELVARGYELEWNAGLIARPEQMREHPRANRDVQVRQLDPSGDELLWSAVLDVQMQGAPDELRGTDYHRTFLERRQEELRETFRSGRGGWYVALLDGVLAGSLGVVVTGSRARYQAVETAAAFRRRGVARRLVVDAARDLLARHEIAGFVIAADPDYHALGIYEDLGFERLELVVGTLRAPEHA